MANWIERKTKTQRISKNASFKSTQTINYGKGITNSQSFGSKNGRTTFSIGPKGTKMYNTVRSGGMYQRTTKTISSTKSRRISKGRKMTKKESETLATILIDPIFWIVAFFAIIFTFFT